jgi:hypothetical protein
MLDRAFSYRPQAALGPHSRGAGPGLDVYRRHLIEKNNTNALKAG